MSIQINIGDHVSTEVDFVVVPFQHRFATSWARERAKSLARGMPSADAYFRTLPSGRSLTQLLADHAHSNGAPGGNSKAAEEALLHCGLGRLSEPGRRVTTGCWGTVRAMLNAAVRGTAQGGKERTLAEAVLHTYIEPAPSQDIAAQLVASSRRERMPRSGPSSIRQTRHRERHVLQHAARRDEQRAAVCSAEGGVG